MIKMDFLTVHLNVRCKYFFASFQKTSLNLLSPPDQTQKCQSFAFHEVPRGLGDSQWRQKLTAALKTRLLPPHLTRAPRVQKHVEFMIHFF